MLLLSRNTKRKYLNRVLFERLISIKVNNSESSSVFHADLMLLTQFFFGLVKTSLLDLEACLMSHDAAS